MNQHLKTFLKFLLFLSIGVVLLWIITRRADLDTMFNELKAAKWGWLIFAMSIGLLSHISRAVRWMIMLEPLGYKPRFANMFSAIMVMYGANFAVPRLGEVMRCTIVNRYEKVPLDVAIGTMITERFFDLICLILVTIVGVSLEYQLVNEKILVKFSEGFDPTKLYILAGFGLGVIILIFLFRNLIKKLPFYQKIRKFLLGMWEGIRSAKDIKKKGWFVIHTIMIWAAYFISFYIAFRALGSTEHLGLKAGLSVLIFGSFGIVVPSPGGLGAFQWLVMIVLWAYGVGGDDFADPVQQGIRLAYGNMMYAANFILLAGGGIIAWVALPLINRKQDVVPTENSE